MTSCNLDVIIEQGSCKTINISEDRQIEHSLRRKRICKYRVPTTRLEVRFPFFFRNKESTDRGESPPKTEAQCAHCPQGKTAKLLLITGEWNFYYCYRCRRWSRSHYTASALCTAVENSRIENSLTWFWRTETEIMEENARATQWIRSILTGRRYDESQSELV